MSDSTSWPARPAWTRVTISAGSQPSPAQPSVGHRFTFRSQPNPQAGFDGIVRSEVLECAPPSWLAYSWAGGPVDTRVSYRLEPDGDGTRVFFEQSGFDLSQPWGDAALRGADAGWTFMLERLAEVVAGLAARNGEP